MTRHITTRDSIKLAEFIRDNGARAYESLPKATNPSLRANNGFAKMAHIRVPKAQDINTFDRTQPYGYPVDTMATQEFEVVHYDELNSREFAWVPVG